jgi:hypothetical protein
MANRALLAKHRLEEFKAWLTAKGVPHRPGRGHYEVLQVHYKPPQWQVLFFRDKDSPHYTVPDPLYPLVRSFIDTTKDGNHHPAPRQQAASEGPQRTEETGGDPAAQDDDSSPF